MGTVFSIKWRYCRYLTLLVVLIGSSGCVRAPIDISQGIAELSVAQVREIVKKGESPASLNNQQLLWGGIVVRTENLPSSTLIEVSGYPLDRRQRPLSAHDTQGRFLITHDGFLEPVDFPPGRSITVLGTFAGVREGKVGAAEYVYPIVQSEDIHAWNPSDLPVKPRLTFGIGINLGN